MNPVLFIAGPLLGFVGMLSGGYWGVGCGWIVVPVLLILGFEPLDAVGIGLLQMVPSTLLTVMRQAPEIGWKPGEPGRSLAIPVGIGALLTSLCGICAVATIWMPVPSATTGLYATVYALVHSMAAHFGQNKGAVADGKSAEVQDAVKAVKGK